MDTFTELPQDYCPYEHSKAVILPVPFEQTTSYLQGTKDGPAAILHASQEIELFDEKLGCEVGNEIGIHTLPPIEPAQDIESFLNHLESVAAGHLHNGKLLVTLGGEHTITLATVRAAKQVYPDIAVLQIDAHADLRDTYRGKRYSHATVMRRVLEHASVHQIGIRSLSRKEYDLIKHTGITTLFAHEISTKTIDTFVDTLPKELYLTIDMDGFDPAVVPGVGNPEPGGLTWKTADYLLDRVSRRCSIKAFDVVELRPLAAEVRSEITAARLIYRLLGYSARDEKISS